MRTILKLNGLRVILAFVATASYVGAILIAVSISGMRQGTDALDSVAVGKFYLMFLPLALVVSAISSAIGWYLSLGTVLAGAGSNRLGAVGCIVEAARLSRLRAKQFAWVGFVAGVLRLMLYGATFFGFFAILGLIRAFPGGIIFGVLLLFTIFYSTLSTLIQLIST